MYYAKNGFPVSEVIAAEWESSMTNARDPDVTSHGKYPDAADGFWETFGVPDEGLNQGQRRAPRAGEIFRNPDLANTLHAIGEAGCSVFYNGSIAKSIAAFASTGRYIKLISWSSLRN